MPLLDDNNRLVWNNKDILESNSVHAMHRSNLIAWLRSTYKGEKLQTRYQIEILCVQMPSKHASWDGYQIRDLGDPTGEAWFPALAIPSCGKAFAENWGGVSGEGWIDFWRDNFAKPLGRSKGEMLALFGFQHMTANAQNMLVAFERAKARTGSGAAAIILRDIGDTLLNDFFYDVLTLIDAKFQHAWAFETSTEDGVTLTKAIGGGYANPLMTRLMTTVIFFFPPFVQGDILAGNSGTILTTWGIAHNVGFLEYMRDAIRYSPDWQPMPQPSGLPTLPVDLGARLRRHSVPKPNDVEYKRVVEDVLELHASQRWTLIEEIESEAASVGAKDHKSGEQLVAAHELLICAEIENYIQSQKGREALAYFHRVYR